MAAAKGNNYNPSGRPKKAIDWEEFEKLCALQCTQAEISGFLDIHIETLIIHIKEHYGEDYSAVYKKYSACGKASLRRTQFKLAQKSAAMAIFLGKQQNWLGQVDTPIEKPVGDDLTRQYTEMMGQLRNLQSVSKGQESIEGSFKG
jgi:hypothetical protein